MTATQSEPDPSHATRPPSAWKPVLIAGITASLVFQILEIILIPLSGGGSPWGTARMIAAMVLGPSVLPPPATFDLAVVTVALIVDIALAVIYTALLSRVISKMGSSTALIVAAIFGVILYGINFYGFTRLFPWFEMGRNLVTLFTHIVFSVTAALVLKQMQVAPKAD